MTPQETIANFLRALYREGDVFEVRVPKCRDPKGISTHSGYYPFAAIDQAAADIAALDERAAAPGIYVTLNAVAPGLLARANGKLLRGAKSTTANTDISRRTRVLVDLDPRRPSGVSSTDAELKAAQELAAQVRSTLADEGWPDPIEGMSGNGVHLIYAVDLPGDDGGLTERVLRGLADRFDTEIVKVDRGVHNASRISKVLGTMARKGEEVVGVEGIEDRRHRRSLLLNVPTTITPVPEEKLEQMAGWQPPRPSDPSPETPGPTPDSPNAETEPKFERFAPTALEVRRYLERHSVKITRERPKSSCTVLDLEKCPVVPDCPAESGSDISVIVDHGGMIKYKNHHDRGQGLKWVDVREALEPGYRNWLAAEKARRGNRRPGSPGSVIPYAATSGGILWNKVCRDGIVPTLITTFTARVIARVTRDDGAEQRQVLTVEGKLRNATYIFDVPADRFGQMNWPMEHMGVGAVVEAGMGAKDHARAAIQHLSPEVENRVVYLHLGWTTIGGKRVFLHAGGGIGADGVVEGVEVSAPGDLARYTLPVLPESEDLKESIRASLRLLQFKPARLGVTLLTGMYRSVLGSCPHSLHIAGSTGALKSSTVGAFLCHFGTFDETNLPGSWVSTENALEAIAFAAKDLPFVVDDFAPTGTPNDQQRLHARAERLLRGAGNQQGRGRLRADTTFRPTKFPRGLIISTGEDVPHGQSLRARVLIIEIVPGEVDPRALAEVQRLAASGMYARAISGYVQWLASRLEEEQNALKERVRALRDGSTAGKGHLRTPQIVAEQLGGLEAFLRFAISCGAITEIESAEHYRHAEKTLLRVAEAQAAHQRESDPVLRFIGLLASSLASGEAHVASAATTISNPEDSTPPDPEAWGWRVHAAGSGRSEWRSSGLRIGWTNGTDLYLDMDAAHRIAERAAGMASIGMQPKTLAKRLWERNMLVRRESEDHIGVKVHLHGVRRRVVHMRCLTLGGPGQSGHSSPDPRWQAPEGDPNPIPCPDSHPDDSETVTQNRDTAPEDVAADPDSEGFAPTAPIVPVLGSEAAAGRAANPGTRFECRACRRVKWWSANGTKGVSWTCGSCHPPSPGLDDILWFDENEVLP